MSVLLAPHSTPAHRHLRLVLRLPSCCPCPRHAGHSQGGEGRGELQQGSQAGGGSQGQVEAAFGWFLGADMRMLVSGLAGLAAVWEVASGVMGGVASSRSMDCTEDAFLPLPRSA